MKPIIRMALRIPSAMPAMSRLPHETRSAESTLAVSVVMVPNRPLGRLLLHENLGEVLVLLKYRHDLVDQRFDVIVGGILALLLQLADKFFVIGAALLEKEPIELGAARRRQPLFSPLPASALATSRRGIAQPRAFLLGRRSYHLISISMVVDQLNCVGTNLVGRSFFFRELADFYFLQIGLMYLLQNRSIGLLTRYLCRRYMSRARLGLSRLGRLRRRRRYSGISIRRRLLPFGGATADRDHNQRPNVKISRNFKLFLYAHVAVLQRESLDVRSAGTGQSGSIPTSLRRRKRRHAPQAFLDTTKTSKRYAPKFPSNGRDYTNGRDYNDGP